MLIVLLVVSSVLWPDTILALIGVTLGATPANRAIFMISLILMGLGSLIVALAAETYLREGVRRGQLVERFLRLALPIVAWLLGGYVLKAILVQWLR